MTVGQMSREEKSCAARDPWGGGSSVKMEGDWSLVTRAKEHLGTCQKLRGEQASSSRGSGDRTTSPPRLEASSLQDCGTW